MSSLSIGDRVLYEGEYGERQGQEAEVTWLGVNDIIEIEFDEEDQDGDKSLTTTGSSIIALGVRETVMFEAFVDDGRHTDLDVS